MFFVPKIFRLIVLITSNKHILFGSCNWKYSEFPDTIPDARFQRYPMVGHSRWRDKYRTTFQSGYLKPLSSFSWSIRPASVQSALAMSILTKVNMDEFCGVTVNEDVHDVTIAQTENVAHCKIKGRVECFGAMYRVVCMTSCLENPFKIGFFYYVWKVAKKNSLWIWES